jgi:hypothetical protein
MPLLNSEQSADSPEVPPMVIKRSPKIILEGTRLTGKTDLAFALNEHPRIVGVRKYRYHSPIISAEWNGFTQQEVVQELFDRSLLPKMVVDVTEKSPDQMVTDVADWLEATGGLTDPDMEPTIAEENL